MSRASIGPAIGLPRRRELVAAIVHRGTRGLAVEHFYVEADWIADACAQRVVLNRFDGPHGCLCDGGRWMRRDCGDDDVRVSRCVGQKTSASLRHGDAELVAPCFPDVL